MNFFFGINEKYLNSTITIPKFNNNSLYKNYSVFSAKPNGNNWAIQKVKCNQSDHFFFIENQIIKNNLIFFLAHETEVDKLIYSNLDDFAQKNNFTDTLPSAFRANLKVYIEGGGFSSYQSEYPYSMTKKNGNILSSLDTLLDKEADLNLILFKNIYYLPNHDESRIFFINIKTKEILDIKKIKNNYSNQIEISKELIAKNVYIFSEKALGVPLYISIKNEHISFEHTHPPHHYILSKDQFRVIGKIKNQIKEMINENA